jgi:predicted permease
MSPLSGRERGVALWVPEFTPEAPSDNNVHLVSVSPDYYVTYGIPLLFGRTFTKRDHQGAPRAAILDETAALFYFGTKNAVGRRVGFRPGDPSYEIVGVVKDVRHQSVRQEPRRSLYLAIPQSIDPAARLVLTVRGSSDVSALAASVQSEIHAAGSSLLITDLSTMEEQVRGALMTERLVATLSMAFGALALALACIGLYGILAYAVARRTSEIGLRMALGAGETGVRWLVLREALALAAVGICVGVPASLWLGQVTRTFLYGVGPMDITTLTITAVVLLSCAAIAGIAPACRASRLNPIAALRSK